MANFLPSDEDPMNTAGRVNDVVLPIGLSILPDYLLLWYFMSEGYAGESDLLLLRPP